MAVIISSGYSVVNEIPTGNIDGINTVYYTAQKFKVNSLKVYRNGVLQKPFVHYCEGTAIQPNTDQGFTMIRIPKTGDRLSVEYDMALN